MAVSSHTLGPGGSPGFFRGYFGGTVDGPAEFPFLPLGFQTRTCSRAEKKAPKERCRGICAAAALAGRPPVCFLIQLWLASIVGFEALTEVN